MEVKINPKIGKKTSSLGAITDKKVLYTKDKMKDLNILKFFNLNPI